MKKLILKVYPCNDKENQNEVYRIEVKDSQYSEELANSLVEMRMYYWNGMLGAVQYIDLVVKDKKEIILKRRYYEYTLTPEDPKTGCAHGLLRKFCYYRDNGLIYVLRLNTVFIYRYNSDDDEYYRVDKFLGKDRYISCFMNAIFADMYQELFDKEKKLSYSFYENVQDTPC